MMYIHLYRTEVRKLGLEWEHFVSTGSETLNLPLLRDVGIKHSKEREYNYVPSDDVLYHSFKRVIYQCHEYDQIFVAEPQYLNPMEYGYTITDGLTIPTLSTNTAETTEIEDTKGADEYSDEEEDVDDGDVQQED